MYSLSMMKGFEFLFQKMPLSLYVPSLLYFNSCLVEFVVAYYS